MHKQGIFVTEGRAGYQSGKRKGIQDEGQSMDQLSPCQHVLARNSKESKNSKFKPELPGCPEGIFVKVGGQTILSLMINWLDYNIMLFRHMACGFPFVLLHWGLRHPMPHWATFWERRFHSPHGSIVQLNPYAEQPCICAILQITLF